MPPMTMEPAGAEGGDAFDLSMAISSLQSNSTDSRIMLKLLVQQLSDVLGGRIVVERAGGRFRKSEEIKSVQITLGDDTLRADVDGATVRCSIGHASGRYPHPQRAGGNGRLADPPPDHFAQRSVP